MRAAILVVLCSCLGVCLTAQGQDDGYKSAMSAWNAAKNRPDYRTYMKVVAEANNRQRLDKPECYQKSPYITVYLILIVGADGHITRVYASDDSPKAQCFKASYLRAQMPIPPFNPLPIRMRMRGSPMGGP